MSVFGDSGFEDEPPRGLICLTAKNIVARWRALLAIAYQRDAKGMDPITQRVFLRGNDCCITCAMNFALATDDDWALVV